ncbi:FHA domain-containing protein [Antarctobacter sp.]|uniref:FHA domain-containing protein n=1 Tax=Antarctobacter sp. TaxID=1872577 RepID=UPI002B2784CD|nr:FHA domain-containing protein [Antarctobacter sp.]
MQGIRNLIARRRPVSEPAPKTDADPLIDPWEELQARVTTPAGHRDCAIDEARAARDYVPRPERPQPMPRKEWTPSAAELADLTVPDPQADAPAQSDAGGTPKIWDLDPPTPDAGPAPSQPQQSQAEPAPSALARSAAGLAAPAAQRPASERVKTRLLGFHTETAGPDPFAAPAASGTASAPRFPIGWIVVIEGPGRGASFTLTAGLSTVGRDADQTVALDFGDTSISRERHISIAHDDEENRTYIGHGGKTNIVRHNDKPLLTTEELTNGDSIKIGKTVLRFVGLCGDGFSWADADTQGVGDG